MKPKKQANQSTDVSTLALTINTPPKKPTRAQIINAMVEVAKQEYEAAKESYQIKKDTLEKQIEEEALKVYTKTIPDVTVYEWSSYAQVNFDVRSPKIARLCKQMNDLERPRWDEKEVRKTIASKLNAPQPPLLSSPEVTGAIKQTLQSWGLI